MNILVLNTLWIYISIPCITPRIECVVTKYLHKPSFVTYDSGLIWQKPGCRFDLFWRSVFAKLFKVSLVVLFIQIKYNRFYKKKKQFVFLDYNVQNLFIFSCLIFSKMEWNCYEINSYCLIIPLLSPCNQMI